MINSFDDLDKAFHDADDEYLNYQRIKDLPYDAPDVCAFFKLSQIYGSNNYRFMITGTDHDSVYIRTEPGLLFGRITQEDVVYLRRCGLCYDDDHQSFYMFT